MRRNEPGAERNLRWVLALALIATIPLAIWSGGCDKETVVEPPSDGGPADTSSDGTDPVDSGGDASALQCCTQAEGNQTECTADGQSVRLCNYYYAAGPACADNPAVSSYGYAWLVSRCPNGCAVSTVAGTTAARCQ